jgi:hypothetical protein
MNSSSRSNCDPWNSCQTLLLSLKNHYANRYQTWTLIPMISHTWHFSHLLHTSNTVAEVKETWSLGQVGWHMMHNPASQRLFNDLLRKQMKFVQSLNILLTATDSICSICWNLGILVVLCLGARFISSISSLNLGVLTVLPEHVNDLWDALKNPPLVSLWFPCNIWRVWKLLQHVRSLYTKK